MSGLLAQRVSLALQFQPGALEFNERLVEGSEKINFGNQFATKAGSPEAVPAYAREFYIEQSTRDREASRASTTTARSTNPSRKIASA